MFKTQAQYDEVVRQNTELTNENTRLQGLVDAATVNASQFQTERETLNQQIATLTSEKEALETANSGLLSEKETLISQVSQLAAENAELSKLPGANSATTISETENGNDGTSDLEKLNQFCKDNANDVNACLAAINKYNNSLIK